MTIDDIVQIIGETINPYVVGYSIIRGQTNRVSKPKPNCLEMTELFSIRQGTARYERFKIIQPYETTIQFDLYGETAGEVSISLVTILNSSFAYDIFPEELKVLKANDPKQNVFVSGEEQFSPRWTFTATFYHVDEKVML